MLKVRLNSIILFLLFFSHNISRSEVLDTYQFINYGIGEGLSQSTVLCSFQDSHGFIWLGTRDGLNQFDGYNFKIFRNIPGDSISIQDNHVNHIVGDNKANIWIATNQGLSKYHLDQPHFVNYQLNIAGTDPEIRTVHTFSDNTLWIGSKDGIFELNQNENIFFKPDHPLVAAVDNKYVTTIVGDRDNNLWVGTTNGLYFFDSAKNEVIIFHSESSNGKNYISHPRVEAILQDREGKIWIGTYGGGVNLIDQQKGYLMHIDAKGHNSVKLTNNFVRSMVLDNDDNLWIGTFEGLNIYDVDHGKIAQIQHSFIKKDGLSHGSIRSLLKDKKGSIWIGTYLGGVNLFDKNNQKFLHYYHVPQQANSLSHDVVSDFVKDNKGNYFIATERGGLNYFNVTNKSFTQIKGTVGATIKSLHIDADNQIWLGTFKEGLWLYDEKNRRIKTFSKNSDQFNFLKNASINNLLEDRQGFLWIATDKNGGIFKFDKNKQQFINFPLHDQLHDLLQNHRVMSVMQDQLGNIWLSTHGEGIVLFNEADSFLKQYKHNNSPGSLNSNEINHIFTDSKGRIWIAGNGGGLSLFDRQKETFTAFTTNENLQNNVVLGIMEDQEGYLWISCINGISRFDPETKVFRNFNFANGLPLQELNWGAFFHDGKNIFLGGNNGFIQFNPDRIDENQYIPKVKITGFRLFNQPVLPGQDNNLLKHHIINTDTVILRHNQSIFTIEFASMSYLKPEQNQYEYQLAGLEEQWNFVENTRYASYSNLQEGTYIFNVRASNNDGFWSKEPTILTIIVKPPYWKTWWAMLIYGFLIIAGVITMRHVSLKSTKMRSEIRLREMENARLEEIHRLKLQSFADVSHEFRTPLTLIIDPLEQVLEKDNQDSWLRKKLSGMHSNARRLLLLINQILDLSELESGNINLKNEPTNLAMLVQNICNSFDGMAEKNQLILKFEHDLPDTLLQVDRDKMEKVIYNLLSNAFKFNRPFGHVKVKLTQLDKINNNSQIQITIEDNGIGINPELKSRVFERFYKGKDTKGTGIGLSLTKSLVDAMGGTIDLMSQPDIGTTFVVIFNFEISDSKHNAKQLYSKPLPVEYNFQIPNTEPEINDDIINSEKKNLPTVLVVEDDADLKNYVKENLGSKIRVITAKNGIKGLEKAKKLNPDLIISDVKMPKMDGNQLCKKIKTNPQLCHIPIILLTSKIQDIDRLQGLEAGADDYLSKPFIMRELLIRINNLLLSRQQLRERYSKELTLPAQEHNLSSYDEQLLEKVQETINREIDNPELNVDFLGEKVGLSRVHLYRKLKTLTGFSPSDLIKNNRMKTAAIMLQQQKINVTEVAYRVGFQDQHYFSKCFKKQFGMSPTEYGQQSNSIESH